MLTAITGINWGDEGKGRMVDLLSENADIVARYQGGNNAGHTVINEYGEFKLNLIPSGIFRKNVINVMGNGMVIDLAHLTKEIRNITEKGVSITPENLKISDKATIVLPYHVELDILDGAVIVQHDEAHGGVGLELAVLGFAVHDGSVGGGANGGQSGGAVLVSQSGGGGQAQDQRENESYDLFHEDIPPLFFTAGDINIQVSLLRYS